MTQPENHFPSTTAGFRVHGALIHGYAEACINLDIVGGKAMDSMAGLKDPSQWHPIETWLALQKIVVQAYVDPAPVMERVGREMMRIWYEDGPGRYAIATGVDFLNYQTGSEGYQSVVNGNPGAIGSFRLLALDTEARTEKPRQPGRKTDPPAGIHHHRSRAAQPLSTGIP